MKRKLFYGLMILISFTIFSSKIKSEKKIIDTKFDRIDSLIRNQSKLQSSTGIAVAIVKDALIIYNKGFGYANLATHDTVTTKTMFHLGSIPKSFVAIALLQLVEQKKVNLDSLVTKYIPELKFKDERYKQITVRHLVTHSSGIFTYHPHDYDNPKHEDDALDKFVRSLDYDELRFNPGEKFSYSDTNYDIVGDIIYRVTGIPFEEYMKKYILNPCEMNQSTFFLPDTNNVARPYIQDYKNCNISRGLLYPVNREHAPDGSLFSNTTEMCNWMTMNMHKGKFGNNTIINASTHDSLWTPKYAVGWDTIFYKSMGIGWFIGMFNNKTTYLHSGYDHGYQSVYCIIPEDKYGIVILSNYRGAPVHFLLNQVLSNLYGIIATEREKVFIPEKEYKEIVGTYVDKSNKEAQITQKGNLLYFTLDNETCCLSDAREDNSFAGQYMENQGWKFYYDQANVFLSKEIDKNLKVRYSIRFKGDIIFEKK
jgi:CubicO group peptidase (beta-lactamase class C family)